ncbi:MAG: FHA domain-containing protein [Burkholderiaceae bacterium]|nr:FHA domain-containing protein [Burkholderiaceae bacterium]
MGRRRLNDIVLAHPAVSGEHAVIVTILDDSYLEDLASTNGSFVNGHRVNKHFLRDQDLITLAKYQLKFVSDGVPPFSAAAAAPMTATIRVVSGANAGKQLTLSKPLTTLGRAGVQVVAIRRAADAYYIEQIEGDQPALLNDAPIGPPPRALAHGDLIELTGTKMVFGLEMQAAD